MQSNTLTRWLSRQILFLSIGLTRLAIRLYGWSDKPRPVQYPPDRRFPFWRWNGERSIESADLAGAIRASLHSAKK
jgi:hypothetical protein